VGHKTVGRPKQCGGEEEHLISDNKSVLCELDVLMSMAAVTNLFELKMKL
jgi:hypothetical protein